MVRTLCWIFLYNAAWLGRTLSICQPPDTEVCQMNEIRYTGTTIHSELSVKDFDTCALHCMWSEERCVGISFQMLDEKGTCNLFSNITGCEDNQENWKSAYDCYASQAGDLFEWKMFPDNLRTDMEGSYTVKEGSDVTLSCSIPRLNDIFMQKDMTYRWYKRTEADQPKVDIGWNDQQLLLKSVQRPSSDDNSTTGGFYSCEISIFTTIIIRSPERHLLVVYLEGIVKGPTMTKFSGSDRYVELKCTPPNSSPPAIIEWYKGNTANRHEHVGKVEGLKYVITDGNLVILNPTKSTAEDHYFCQARNAVLNKSVKSNTVKLLYCDGKNCDPDDSNSAFSAEVSKLEDIDEAFKGKTGVWLKEEKVFRCFFKLGDKITWKYGNEEDVTEGDGAYLMEGNQVLMLSTDKIRRLRREGVNEVTCGTTTSDDTLKISLPSSGEDFIEKTFMLNLEPDIREFDETAGRLFQEESILRDREEGKYLLASTDITPQDAERHIYLDFLALKGENCGEFKLPTCSFRNLPLGENATNNSCPGVTVHCKLQYLTKTEYWINDTRSGCKLEEVDNHILDYVNVLEGQLLDLTLNGEPCPVSSQLMLQELEEKQSHYTEPSRLNAALIILSKISTSQNVSSNLRTRAKNLRLIYIKNGQSEGLNSIVHGKNISMVLWEVTFPLAERATLEFPLQDGRKESELTLTMPTGLNDIAALNGSQYFVVSLYHDPENDFNSPMEGTSYASKVVDIDPPTKLSGLREDQEITFGIRIIDSDTFNLKYHPSCFWYDEKTLSWKTDGVMTTGFNGSILECSTNHLTAFSALMSTGLRLPPIHERIISYLTYVCGGLSCLALVLTLIALTYFKDIRRSPSNKIHVCLTTTMLLAMLLFIGGAKRYENINEDVCKAVAITLHYLWLSVFMWTVVESYNLYVLFIRILSARSSRFILKFAVLVIVIPGVIVGLTAGLSYDSYTDENYCLLRLSDGADIPVIYYSFHLPIGVSIVVNGGIFLSVIVKIFKKARYQHFESKVQKVLSQMKAVCTLSCVLGLTWVLGFLTFEHPAAIAFHYLFTICNSIQGMLIFIFHCAIKPDVYQKWLYFLCNIGNDSKSTPSSRSNTPTKSRLNLFTGMFQKRSSTVTLSTTVTKLSLTKQLTRQRTDSKDSLTSGMQTAFALMKKASLEPLEEKDSSVASPREEPRKIVRKQMLSSHSSIGDSPGHDITPPGNAIPSYFEFLEPQETKPSAGKTSLPRTVLSAETRIRDVVAGIVPDRHGGKKITEVSAAINKDRVMIAGKNIIKSKQFQIEEESDQVVKELNLEERLFRMGSSNSPDNYANSSSSGKRSVSPLDLKRGRRKITPTPPPHVEAVYLRTKPLSKLELEQPETLAKDAKLKGKLTPKTSLEIKPPTPITSKLSQLEEWIL